MKKTSPLSFLKDEIKKKVKGTVFLRVEGTTLFVHIYRDRNPIAMVVPIIHTEIDYFNVTYYTKEVLTLYEKIVLSMYFN